MIHDFILFISLYFKHLFYSLYQIIVLSKNLEAPFFYILFLLILFNAELFSHMNLLY